MSTQEVRRWINRILIFLVTHTPELTFALVNHVVALDLRLRFYMIAVDLVQCGLF